MLVEQSFDPGAFFGEELLFDLAFAAVGVGELFGSFGGFVGFAGVFDRNAFGGLGLLLFGLGLLERCGQLLFAFGEGGLGFLELLLPGGDLGFGLGRGVLSGSFGLIFLLDDL